MPESVAVGLLTFFLGLIVGHRMALWRERRKEFNEVAARIRVALKSRLQSPRPRFGTKGNIEATDMELFQHLLGRGRRWRFHRAWRNYESACQQTSQNELGELSYQSPEVVSQALERVIAFAALR